MLIRMLTQKVQIKIAVVFLLVAFLGSAMNARHGYVSIQKQSQDSAIAELGRSTAAKAEALESNIRATVGELDLVAMHPALENATTGSAEQATPAVQSVQGVFAAAFRERPSWTALLLFDASNHQIVSAKAPSRGETAAAASHDRISFQPQALLQRFFAAPSVQTLLVDLELETTSAGLPIEPYRPLLTIARAIRNGDRLQGMLVATMEASFLNDFKATMSANTLLFNQAGFYLANADGSREWGDELGHAGRVEQDFGSLARGLLSTEAGVQKDKDVWIIHQPVFPVATDRSQYWIVAQSIRPADIEEGLRPYLSVSLAWMLASLGITLFGVILVRRWIVVPLKDTVTVLKSASEGNLTDRLSGSGHDEMGQMARALNHTLGRGARASRPIE